jgi:hypothetical protein
MKQNEEWDQPKERNLKEGLKTKIYTFFDRLSRFMHLSKTTSTPTLQS